MRPHLCKRDERSGQPWPFQKEEEGRETATFRHSPVTPGTGWTAIRYSKGLHIKPQQDLKMARKCIQISILLVSPCVCVRNDPLQSLSLPVGDSLELSHVPAEVGIGRSAQAAGAQQESTPTVPDRTWWHRAAHSSVPQHGQEANALMATERPQGPNPT